MLWNRYANPIEILSTYNLKDAVDFILYLFEKEQDDLIWQTWLHRKPTKGEGKNVQYLTYPDYKKSLRTPPIRGNSGIEKLTVDQEKQRLDFASQYIKPRKEPNNGSR